MVDAEKLLGRIRSIHEQIRGAVTSACESSSSADLSQVLEDGDGDTIYSVDRVSESMLVALFEKEIASQAPILLIAEGLSGGKIALPRGCKESDAAWRIIPLMARVR